MGLDWHQDTGAKGRQPLMVKSIGEKLTYEVFELLQLVVGENDSLQVGQALFEALPDAAEGQEEEKQVLFWQCARLL